MTKKICFITSARSEYGLIKWIMKDIETSEEFKLQLIVTGAHFSKEQGYTVQDIRNDGFKIDIESDIQLDTSSKSSIASCMGKISETLAPALESLQPDYVVVLGDRYELLPICSTVYVMNIPIIHISGGDITEGAIDNGIRNAVTMLATYHFPCTNDSRNNIIRMRGSDSNVWTIGEPGLDYINRIRLLERKEIAENLGISCEKQWVLFTYHSETEETLEYNLNAVKACFTALKKFTGIQIIATYSNADYGGKNINDYITEIAIYEDNIFVIPSLGNLRYISLMKQCAFMIGNSSSGIIEAPAMKCPVINVGNRQKGRYLCGNIIQTDANTDSIVSSISKVMNKEIDLSDTDYWGDGHTSERVLSILKKEICNFNAD